MLGATYSKPQHGPAHAVHEVGDPLPPPLSMPRTSGRMDQGWLRLRGLEQNMSRG